ncbi:GNAT family N-acetyltransferase [Bacillus sp. SCS-151]|uniref:GNAT family N-acetyltransferase n=1 Tax=Nanhaiella sioensis TaxID=3115293 RepID=UPI00397BE9D7
MIRSYKLEDINYIISTHYEIYHKEFHYDESFKEFIQKKVWDIVNRSHVRENIWVVEKEGDLKGSVCINQFDSEIAQLGLFLIDPLSRGLGIGSQLIKTAITFSTEKKYKKIILWTNSDLIAARNLYKKFGFEIVETQEVFLSNIAMVEERWELILNSEGERKGEN